MLLQVKKNEPVGFWEGFLVQAADYAPKLLLGLVVFFAFWLAASMIGKFIRRFGERTGLDPHVLNLIRQVVKTTLIVLGLVTALGTVGINVSALVAGLGLMGFALGFALKDALSNLLSGVLILVYRPFKIDDRISVAGIEGAVANIDLRYTTLKDKGKTYLIPNSTLFTKAITILNSGEDKQP
ncbi:MAG: mechanosensitive ion channel domain-containing protein [Thermodesulfobacteriota bacterium]